MRRLAVVLLPALFAALTFGGCSLLKVAVATGDPLSKEEMRIRTLTRGFYYDLAGEVSRAADSIVDGADRYGIRIAALQWKIRATRAGVTAAMQGIPDVALADLWILCRRMHEGFAATPDSLLFGRWSDIARRTAARLDRQAAQLAAQLLAADRYDLMEQFVGEYVRTNPAADGSDADNTTLAWFDYLKAHGIEPTYAVGSIAEVLSDVNDRVSGQTQQFSSSLGWSKEILEMRFAQDSLQSRLAMQLDSLEADFGRLVVVAEHLPEISEQTLGALNDQATQLIGTMNASVEEAFAAFDRQRMELQGYVSREREALVGQLRSAGEELVRAALDEVPGLIGRVVLYVVLALVVLIGGPFALGFWLGGVRQRARARRGSGTPEA